MSYSDEPSFGATLRFLRNLRRGWTRLRPIALGIVLLALVMISYGTPFLLPLGVALFLIVAVAIIRRRTNGSTPGH